MAREFYELRAIARDTALPSSPPRPTIQVSTRQSAGLSNTSPGSRTMTYTGLPIAILAEAAMYSAMIPSAKQDGSTDDKHRHEHRCPPLHADVPTAFAITLRIATPKPRRANRMPIMETNAAVGYPKR